MSLRAIALMKQYKAFNRRTKLAASKVR